MSRNIPMAPIYMNPMHFETDLKFEYVEKTIRRTLDAYKIPYSYSNEIPVFKINTSALSGEIRIFKDINDVDYVIEFVRYKGDGFRMNELFAKIYEILVTPNKVNS